MVLPIDTIQYENAMKSSEDESPLLMSYFDAPSDISSTLDPRYWFGSGNSSWDYYDLNRRDSTISTQDETTLYDCSALKIVLIHSTEAFNDNITNDLANSTGEQLNTLYNQDVPPEPYVKQSADQADQGDQDYQDEQLLVEGFLDNSSSGSPRGDKRHRHSKMDESASMSMSPAESSTSCNSSKSKRDRERNRMAANKCRQKARANVEKLQQRERELSQRNKVLVGHAGWLREEVLDLKNEILRHSSCDSDVIQRYITKTASEI